MHSLEPYARRGESLDLIDVIGASRGKLLLLYSSGAGFSKIRLLGASSVGLTARSLPSYDVIK